MGTQTILGSRKEEGAALTGPPFFYVWTGAAQREGDDAVVKAEAAVDGEGAELLAGGRPTMKAAAVRPSP
jgi:hypothetical protein